MKQIKLINYQRYKAYIYGLSKYLDRKRRYLKTNKFDISCKYVSLYFYVQANLLILDETRLAR